MKIFGLIRGRHSLPTNEYIFDSIEDVHNYAVMSRRAAEFFSSVGFVEYNPYRGDRQTLTVYVTGLTAALVSVLAEAAIRGVVVRCMHYDNSSGEYREQVFEGAVPAPYGY